MESKEFKLTVLTILCITLITILGMWMFHTQKMEEYKLKYTQADRIMAIVGKVTGKTYANEKYTLEIGGYGKFLVSRDVWDKARVGDIMPLEIHEQVDKLQSVGG